ncbi:MAG TPA: hypothetical protein VE988_18725 [Gemmataceae bacterium]|nr:hypothetical protein [Gemmataceae bacterium]
MVFPRDPKDAALEVRLVDKGSSARLFDSVTGKELPKVEQLDEFGFGPIWRVTLSPDNKRLAACGRLKLGTSGEPLLTILLMDVSPWRDQALKTRKEPTAKELTAMWDDLGSDEPAKALQSLRRMRASSAQTILSFLKEHLRPVAYDTKRIPFYIARLGDKSFKIRAEAESELLKMAEHAEAALKKVLDNPPSLEERIRLQGIMDVLNKGSWPPPPARRLLWSIEFLERDATPAAVELLERMATGGPEAWVTHEAATSLERLGKGTKAKK